jgi:hypothetical protein
MSMVAISMVAVDGRLHATLASMRREPVGGCAAPAVARAMTFIH